MAIRHKILIGLQFVLALFVLLEGSPASAQKALPRERPDRYARKQGSRAG